MPISKSTFYFDLNTFLKIIFSFTFLFFLAGTVDAQNTEIKDPMNKPDLWKKLKHNPNNQVLWESYLGKKIQDFTDEDNDKIATWQEQLMVLQAEHADVIITSKANTAAADEDILRDMQVGEWQNMEEVVMSTGSEIEEMRQNIDANFALLEDLYSESFEEQGLKYIAYNEAHPDGKYSKTAWIEIQEEKLRQAKLKELQALRSQVKKN
ncbi:hypothetical protein Fleli_0951 [Bernardetia litoralis DSM 6794]|uniref:Uncharacterized protein n=1 Tax=Bernardetia litoralis (strain ATCC 23117 / DSM 6794 / NBRC 15988 / NCIMB 1366 / Fx l1 / Sio-4) TaxID=880071 RepID=I4AHH0_BERLS|nr:hypothetical protein [Bernardetia litoralis]AFM03405.1 hypothetical protein Fleli_0951 [Bernardetia litoralis DSM 6794]